MTENQKIFCEGVARLCEAANTPELFKPIIKIWSLYEAEGENGGEVTDFNMENLSAEELAQVQPMMTKLSEAKKKADQASKEADQLSSDVANTINGFANNNERKPEQPASTEGEANG